MSLFLFLKQIADVLYPYRWLDYTMVLFVVVALIYQVALVRPSIKGHVNIADVCILGLIAIVLGHFILEVGNGILNGGTDVAAGINNGAGTADSLQGTSSRHLFGHDGILSWNNLNGSGIGVFLKILSAFLMYFVGRIYSERILECEGAMALSSYLVVYANLIYRVVQHGTRLFRVIDAKGDLYYYDTDMAYAMLVALVIIAMFARNSIFKLLTMFLVIPYMIICSCAGMQKGLLIIFALLLVLYALERIGVPRRVGNCMLTVAVVGLLVCVGIAIAPVFTGDTNLVTSVFDGKWMNGSDMLGRYGGWNSAWSRMMNSNWMERLFGVAIHTTDSISNQYLKTVYGTGLVGALLTIVLTISMVVYGHSIRDRKTYYTMVLFAMVFLGTGLLKDCMESTQMSWFFMMFLGMVASGQQTAGESAIDN